MTRNLIIVNKWGVRQGSDHRLVDLITRKVVDNTSIEHVILRCTDAAAPPSYAGIESPYAKLSPPMESRLLHASMV